MRPNLCFAAATAASISLLLSTSSASASPFSACALDDVGDLRLVARRDHDAIAALEQDRRQFAAEAGRTAGNEPDGFSGTVRHCKLLSLEDCAGREQPRGEALSGRRGRAAVSARHGGKTLRFARTRRPAQQSGRIARVPCRETRIAIGERDEAAAPASSSPFPRPTPRQPSIRARLSRRKAWRPFDSGPSRLHIPRPNGCGQLRKGRRHFCVGGPLAG